MGDFPSYLSGGSLPLVPPADYHVPSQQERFHPSKAPLETCVSRLQCALCSADLCLTSQIISKGFTGRYGRAYLVSAASTTRGKAVDTEPASTSLPNTRQQRVVPRQLVTGEHTVCDICCEHCGSVLGWKYVYAEEESQRYKIGKFILETKRINRASRWEDAFSTNVATQDLTGVDLPEDVEFDSQNEDECDHLFSGTWSPMSASQRRGNR